MSKAPKEVRDALTEWDNLKKDTGKFAKLQTGTVSSTEAEWKSAANTLESLQITQMFRESFIEWFHRTVLNERVNGERLLPNTYSWTKSRGSDGSFVGSGFFVGGGGLVGRAQAGVSRIRISAVLSPQ